MRLIASAVVWLICVCGAAAQTAVTQAQLLRRLIDLDRLARPPAGEQVEVIAFGGSATGGGATTASASDWTTLAEVRGPGALTALWFSQVAGELRLVLDDTEMLTAPVADVVGGKRAPFNAPLADGSGAVYFPLGFARRALLMGHGTAGAGAASFVMYPEGTLVERFKPELDEAAEAALRDVRSAMETGLTDRQLAGDAQLMPVAVQEDLGPGRSLAETMDGAGTVRGLYVAVTDQADPRDLYALHHCVLRVFVDGADTPQVEAPLVDFFGSGYDLVPFQSLVIGTDRHLALPLPDRRASERRFMYCLFPMPYRDGLRIEIENRNAGRREIGLLLYFRIDLRPPADDALRFHAAFRRGAPRGGAPYALLEATGGGRAVGWVLNVDRPALGGWGVASVHAARDGGAMQTLGASLAGFLQIPDEASAPELPLHGVTRVTPYGKRSAYRWQIADDLPFERSLQMVAEWPNDEPPQTYVSSMAYWYASAGGGSTFGRLTNEDLALAGLRIPGAIEIEDLLSGSGWGTWLDEGQAGKVELSGGMAAMVSTTDPIGVKLPPGPSGEARLSVRVVPGRAFEPFTVETADGRVVGTVKYARTADGVLPCGEFERQGGGTVLRLKFSSATIVDCLVVEPNAK